MLAPRIDQIGLHGARCCFAAPAVVVRAAMVFELCERCCARRELCALLSLVTCSTLCSPASAASCLSCSAHLQVLSASAEHKNGYALCRYLIEECKLVPTNNPKASLSFFAPCFALVLRAAISCCRMSIRCCISSQSTAGDHTLSARAACVRSGLHTLVIKPAVFLLALLQRGADALPG